MFTADIVVQPPSEAPSRPRFCSQCGAVRDPVSGECANGANCAPHESHSSAVTAENEKYRLEVRSLRSALWLYFSLLAVSATFIICQLATGSEGSAVGELVTSVAFSLPVVVWAAASFALIVNLLKTRFHARWILLAVCAAFPTYLMASGVVDFLVQLGVERGEYLAVFTRDGYGFAWAVATVCIQPAIFEEIAFRGIIQGSLGRFLGEREALIVSALMFGILHLSIPSLPHLLVMGLVLGWLRLRTQSLLPGMALHFTHNFLVLLSEQTGSLLPW